MATYGHVILARLLGLGGGVRIMSHGQQRKTGAVVVEVAVSADGDKTTT